MSQMESNAADAARIREIRDDEHECSHRDVQRGLTCCESEPCAVSTWCSDCQLGYALDALARSDQARQQLETDLSPFLKDGETPAECVIRNRKDVDTALSLLVKEKAARQEAEQRLSKSKELSDAYLRVRSLVNAWDTKEGGSDRFEVTERHIKEIIAARKQAEAALATLTAERDALLRQQTSLSEERNQANLDFTLERGQRDIWQADAMRYKERAERLEIECQQLRAALEICHEWLQCDLETNGPGPADGYKRRVELIAAALTSPPSRAALRGQDPKRL